jgi:hypothetical protein
MKHRPCAGLDLQPRLVGSQALEQLVAQLHRNEFGIPVVPSATTVAPRWSDGPTVRQVAICPQNEGIASGASADPAAFQAPALRDTLPWPG